MIVARTNGLTHQLVSRTDNRACAGATTPDSSFQPCRPATRSDQHQGQSRQAHLQRSGGDLNLAKTRNSTFQTYVRDTGEKSSTTCRRSTNGRTTAWYSIGFDRSGGALAGQTAVSQTIRQAARLLPPRRRTLPVPRVQSRPIGPAFTKTPYLRASTGGPFRDIDAADTAGDGTMPVNLVFPEGEKQHDPWRPRRQTMVFILVSMAMRRHIESGSMALQAVALVIARMKIEVLASRGACSASADRAASGLGDQRSITA